MRKGMVVVAVVVSMSLMGVAIGDELKERLEALRGTQSQPEEKIVVKPVEKPQVQPVAVPAPIAAPAIVETVAKPVVAEPSKAVAENAPLKEEPKAAVAPAAVEVKPGLEAAAPVSVSVDATIASAYVWRGQVLNDEAVLQPSATIGKGAFSFNVWGSLNLTDKLTEDPGEFTEIDLLAKYVKTLGIVDVGLGYYEYLFPHQALIAYSEEGNMTSARAYPGTREVSADLSLNNLPVKPGLLIVRDVDEADGFYYSASLSYTAVLSDNYSIALRGAVGMGDADFNMFYYGVDKAKVSDATGKIALNCVCGGLTIAPYVEYDAIVADELKGVYFEDKITVVGVYVAGTL